MSHETATLVVTTISDPALLKDYTSNFRRYGHLDEVEVIVIPDEKTPSAAYARCRNLTREGLRVTCPTIEEQERFLTSLGLPPGAVPHNSDNRRNIGYLMAYGSGSDFVISIDDDNYCLPDEDYFAEHAVVCRDNVTIEVADSATGYLNLCNLLDVEPKEKVYPRGFPFRHRHCDEQWQCARRRVPVHINAGLWTLDPDIDAISWLTMKPHAAAFRGRSIALGANTWAPVNSQNTAMRREALPAYYFIRMGYPISGLFIDRYGDILSGYFVQACARHLGGYVRAGTPIAEHRRNTHNYMKDATAEWACILALEDILPWLTDFRLQGSSYLEAFESLSYGIQDAVEDMRGAVWTDATRGYFHQMAYHMRLWLRACRTLSGVAAAA